MLLDDVTYVSYSHQHSLLLCLFILQRKSKIDIITMKQMEFEVRKLFIISHTPTVPSLFSSSNSRKEQKQETSLCADIQGDWGLHFLLHLHIFEYDYYGNG